jgi:hypothetical protein
VEGKNLQASKEKNTANPNFLTCSHLKLPNYRHWDEQYQNVGYHVGGCVADVVVIKVISISPGGRISDFAPEV